jgi:phosphate transport system permease protein
MDNPTIETAVAPKKRYKLKIKLSKVDATTKWTIIIATVFILLALLVIVGFITYKSVPIFHDFGFFKFIFSSTWNPGSDGDANASYGILGIIGSTIMMLLISLVIAVPLTIFGSLFICEYLKPKAKAFVTSFIQLMAGIPSVVFGLFAIDQIGKLMVMCGASTPGNMMTAAITLAFMALPTMMSLTIDAIESVPDGYRFASLGLGVTREKTTFNVIFKTALPKIISAIIIGIARIIGETMAVIMIAGGSAAGLNANSGLGGFLFSSVRTLAGTIGLEMLENSGSTHESALYAIGFILFGLVIIINLFVLAVSHQRKNKIVKRKIEAEEQVAAEQTKPYSSKQLKSLVNNYTEKRAYQTFESIILKFFMITSLAIVLGFIVWILATILFKGVVGFSWGSFITIDGNRSGILATLLVTVLLVLATLTFAIPFALIVAIYLAEYASEKNFFTKFIRFGINLLSSTPSIVFGVFGLSLFITIMHIPMSILASSFTMTLVVIPSMIIVFEDSIKSVPKNYREAAYGMGLGRTATLWKVVLPSSFKGMITGIILTIARIVGESAPIYLTLGTAVRLPGAGFLSSGATMTTEIYILVSEGSSPNAMNDAYMLSFFALLIIILLNYVSHFVSLRLTPGFKKPTWANRAAQLKLTFSKSMWQRNWKAFAYFFIRIGKGIGRIFDVKYWKQYRIRHKQIAIEIKKVKKEVLKNGRSKKAN